MLKGFFEREKGSSLRWKIKGFRTELRYAWQRVWRGYDDSDVFNLNIKFLERYTQILKNFKENSVATFSYPDIIPITWEEFEANCYTEEETNTVLNRMIYCFENADAEDEIDALSYKYNIGSDSFDREAFHEEALKANESAQANLQEGLVLFSKHFRDLWY